MPRRAEIQTREPDPDPVYSSKLVSQVINKVMNRGKKSTAEHIVYRALDMVGEKTGKPPVEILEQAVKTVTPVLEVRSRRVGGANYQVPVEVPQRRARTLAVRWLVSYARERREKHMEEKVGWMISAARFEGTNIYGFTKTPFTFANSEVGLESGITWYSNNETIAEFRYIALVTGEFRYYFEFLSVPDMNTLEDSVTELAGSLVVSSRQP